MQQSHIEREKKTIALMIRLYCRKKEKNSELCSSCRKLIEYAHQRLDHCPFGEAKTSCKNCAIHCYAPIERKRVRQVMRYIGPRMIYLAPANFFFHLFKK